MIAQVLYTETVTPPASTAVSLSEAKEYLRIDTGDTSQDTILNLLIAQATEAVEAYTWTTGVTRTLRTTLGAGRSIRLPYAPVTNITLVVESGTANTIDYELCGDVIQLKEGSSGTQVTYIAGSAVAPPSFKVAVLTFIADRFEIRTGVVTDMSANTINDLRWKKIAHPLKRYN